ncbi:nadh dehydrogenase [Limosa lapponica baueri]|uniref:NADH dehydrogenase [ubiquinone] 1 beta subcomplex subunit 2, mitochondrial n=6 Tax=Charadriiformes TaxID=8906 RepID=A0A2I0TSB5_LIMLA|nr:nadh dehydrogenase [Limosa lapponica baueri]
MGLVGHGKKQGKDTQLLLQRTSHFDSYLHLLGNVAQDILAVGKGVQSPSKEKVKSNAGGGVHIPPRYRQFPQLTRAQVIQSEILSGFMWFWILWHFWHSSDMVLGHFPYPDPAAWTDEELGIPPDDAE